MLRELEVMGVKDIITFDAHDPRVQNAVPLMGFDNFFPCYQILKAVVRKYPDIVFDKEHTMIISPDEGAMSRNIYYASVLGLDLGMFYKRRDFSVVINGRNPIVAHEYIGNPVAGKDILVADDIIATGDSMLHLAKDLKDKGARRIILVPHLRNVYGRHGKVRQSLCGRCFRRRYLHKPFIHLARTFGKRMVFKGGIVQIYGVYHFGVQPQRVCIGASRSA